MGVRIADFAETGNIEITRGNRRELVGQFADSKFIVHERYRGDQAAQARIEVCRLIAERYGIHPEVVYKEY